MRKEAYELLHRGAFIPAMPLVLHEDRSFDERGQRRLIRYYLACGADGIAAGVHSTQFAIRDPKIGLFEPVLRCAQEEIAAYRARTGREVLAVAGVCGETEQAVQEADDVRTRVDELEVFGGHKATGSAFFELQQDVNVFSHFLVRGF